MRAVISHSFQNTEGNETRPGFFLPSASVVFAVCVVLVGGVLIVQQLFAF